MVVAVVIVDRKQMLDFWRIAIEMGVCSLAESVLMYSTAIPPADPVRVEAILEETRS